MHIESILRRLHPLPGFVYEKVSGLGSPRAARRSRPHSPAQRTRVASARICFRKRPGYDVLG